MVGGEINLTVSRAILDEMADVLARKFRASPEEVAEATAIVKEAARTVTPVVVFGGFLWSVVARYAPLNQEIREKDSAYSCELRCFTKGQKVPARLVR
jgi:hypothetical protein